MKELALAIADVTIGYRDGKRLVPVVEAINATLHTGEVVALIGLNGAGKSTLLRTISAFQQPLSGRVELAMGDAARLSPQELARCIGGANRE